MPILAYCAAATVLGSVETPKPSRLASIKYRLDAVCDTFHGRMGYWCKNLRTGEEIGHREAERFPSASTIKTAIMIEAVDQIEEGKLKWTDKLEIPPKGKRNDSMWAAYLLEGTKVNIDGLVNLMMNVSDNTAAVMLADKVGVENIERRLLSRGCSDTACTIHSPKSNQRLTRLHETFQNMGVTSPREMGGLLELIYRRKAASPTACERMMRIMSHQYWDDFFVSQIPPGVFTCSKVGALERSRSDTLIAFGRDPYILTAYTDNAKDRSWGDSNEGHESLRKISSIVWNALNPDRPYKMPADAPRWFPTGSGVEDS